MNATHRARSAVAISKSRSVHASVWLLAILFSSVFWAPASAQTLTQSNISAAQARLIVDAIIAKCSPRGNLLTVSIAVVDRAGLPVLQIRADTASPHNWELAYRKAYTARTFQRPTLQTRDRTGSETPLAGQRFLTNVVALGGGVPIMKDGGAIGGIGVSGAKGGQENDNACAEAGLAAIADQLD